MISNIAKDLQIDLIQTDIDVANKEEALRLVSQKMAKHIGCSTELIYNRLIEKEHMASSGIGEGIAMPYMRILQMEKPLVMLTTLKKPIEFDAIDNAPVDIICTVISPRRDGALHLRRISRLTRMLSDHEIAMRIRNANNVSVIRSAVASPAVWNVSAA